MPGLTLLLETARRALLTQQVALSVTSHNVANASTPGYSRQRAELVPTMPLQQSYGLLGTGVTTLSIDRLRDQFIDQQIRIANQVMSQADMKHQILSQIEANLNEPSSGGLNEAMTAFFNAWQDLSTHPEDTSTRNAVYQQGMTLSQTFHRMSTEMSQLQSSLLDDINTKLGRINTLSQEISDLDVQITNSRATGAEPNDAEDQRDLKLEELSKLANIAVSFDKNGSVMVSMGGALIASRAGASRLSASISGTQVSIVANPGGVSVPVGGGELGGVLDMNNRLIPDYQAKLDQLAVALVNSVNALHTGTNFFSGTNAATISVDAAIDPAAGGNLANIVTSSDGTAGNNDIAIAIAGLMTVPQAALGGSSLSQYYNAFVSQIGSDTQTADSVAQSQQLVIAQLQNQQSSVAGVSLDEEMANLIKFQRSYDAAAKLVTVTDEMFQSILNMV